jgi:hypothetical protein
MQSLPEEDEYAIGDETAKTALSLLSSMRDRAAAPPMLLPYDSGALAFTWDFGACKRYLTIDGQQAHFMDYYRADGERNEGPLDLVTEPSRTHLLRVLAGNPLARTAT